MTGIRQVTLDRYKDLSALFDQYQQSRGLPSHPRQAARYIKEQLRTKGGLFFLASVDGRPSGFVHCTTGNLPFAPAAQLLIKDLYVLPSHSSLTIRLLEEALTHCLFEGYRSLVVDSSSESILPSDLELLGFRPEPGTFYYFWVNTEE